MGLWLEGTAAQGQGPEAAHAGSPERPPWGWALASQQPWAEQTRWSEEERGEFQESLSVSWTVIVHL